MNINCIKCGIPAAFPSSQSAELSKLQNEYRYLKEDRENILKMLSAVEYGQKDDIKRFVVALEAGLLSLRHVVSALHANNAISPDARVAINMMKDALATETAKKFL